MSISKNCDLRKINEQLSDIVHAECGISKMDEGVYRANYVIWNREDYEIFIVENTTSARVNMRNCILKKAIAHPGIYGIRLEKVKKSLFCDQVEKGERRDVIYDILMEKNLVDTENYTLYRIVYTIPYKKELVDMRISPAHNLQFADELYQPDWVLPEN